MCFCIIDTKCKFLLSINKDWNILLKFLGEVTPLVFKNNFRIILGSKSEKFKNIEARKKIRYSYKKERTFIFPAMHSILFKYVFQLYEFYKEPLCRKLKNLKNFYC